MTIDFDISNPVNAIRIMVGDVDLCNPIMSDNMYQQFFDLNNINDRNECVVVWFSAIQAASIIYAQYAPNGQRYRERVNAVEVENYGGERAQNYKNLLDWLKGNPPLNCPMEGSLFGFGGTYTKCDAIYTVRYINDCICSCWGWIWKDGYYAECPDLTTVNGTGCC